MNAKLLLFVLLCLPRGLFGQCNQPQIAHAYPLYIAVTLKGSVVSPPWASTDRPKVEQAVAEEIIKIVRRGDNLRVPWRLKVADFQSYPQISIEVSDQLLNQKPVNWIMTVDLKSSPTKPLGNIQQIPLLPKTALSFDEFPPAHQVISFVANRFVEEYIAAVKNSVEGIRIKAIRPLMWKHFPVTKGILSPDPMRIQGGSTLAPDQSLIMLSLTCYDEYREDRFRWKFEYNPDVTRFGRNESESQAVWLGVPYDLDGQVKHCLVVKHPEPVDRQRFQNIAEVYLTLTPMPSDDWTIASN